MIVWLFLSTNASQEGNLTEGFWLFHHYVTLGIVEEAPGREMPVYHWPHLLIHFMFVLPLGILSCYLAFQLSQQY